LKHIDTVSITNIQTLNLKVTVLFQDKNADLWKEEKFR